MRPTDNPDYNRQRRLRQLSQFKELAAANAKPFSQGISWGADPSLSHHRAFMGQLNLRLAGAGPVRLSGAVAALGLILEANNLGIGDCATLS